jgi:hypothetical protein
MKKIITLVLIITFGIFSSCTTNNDTSAGNNNVEYEFTITVNGQVHKVKGNTRDGIPTATSGAGYISNKCISVNNSAFGASVQLGINDVTTPNYISGQNMQIIITLPNPLLGTNQASISFSGNYFDTLASSLGAYTNTGFNSYSSTLVAVNGGSRNTIIPFVISDLGTPTTLVNNGSTYSFGQTIKGNYSGTIYLNRCSNLGTSNGGCYYDIPVQLSIDFKAVRLN